MIRMIQIWKRLKAPTPLFFRKLRTMGMLVTAVGTVLLTAPVGLPLLVVQLAGYLTVTGGVLTAVSQTTVIEDAP
jgi:hypothetical protein